MFFFPAGEPRPVNLKCGGGLVLARGAAGYVSITFGSVTCITWVFFKVHSAKSTHSHYLFLHRTKQYDSRNEGIHTLLLHCVQVVDINGYEKIITKSYNL